MPLPDQFTPNKNIDYPIAGSYNNTWAVPLQGNWLAIDTAFGGVTSISVTGVGAGNYVLTVAQYQPPNIEFTGTLGASLTYAVPPGVGGLWSVSNATSGAFTLTFASSGGSSVVVPQGRRALLICDGANMQYAQTGGAVSANPSAQVSTSAINGSAATFMTSDSAPAIDQTMAPSWTGVHRFLNSVILQGSPNYVSGLIATTSAVSDFRLGQALVATENPGDNSTNAASTAFVYALGALKANLASPALTGTPTVVGSPPALGTATTQIATTAFATGTGSLATNGYWVFSSGLIMQWGVFSVASYPGTSIALPTTFPNAIFMASCTPYGLNSGTAGVSSVTTSHLTLWNSSNAGVSFIAIGN